MREKKIVHILVGMAAVSVVFLVGSFNTLGQESGEVKVARLLNDSNIKFTKIDKTTWTIPFEGRSMKDITVVTSVGQGVVVVFALIPDSKNIRFPAATLQKLLNLNEAMDRVKIGIDKPGLVFVRIDMTLRTLDQEELSTAIDQVAAAVDEVHGNIREHLPKGKGGL